MALAAERCACCPEFDGVAILTLPWFEAHHSAVVAAGGALVRQRFAELRALPPVLLDAPAHPLAAPPRRP